MSYVFVNGETSTLQFKKTSTTARTLTLPGINSTITSAQTIINGVNRLFYIADQEDDYDAEDAVRTVKQYVTTDS